MRRWLTLLALGLAVGCGSQEEEGPGAGPSRIAVVGDYENGITVLDLSDPQNPQEIGVCDVGGVEPGVMEGELPYAYIGVRGGELAVVDLSDPQNPQRVGSLYLDEGVWGLCLAGSYLYVANDDSGLVIVDVSDPTNPVKVGQCTLESYSYATEVSASGSTAYVACGYVDGYIVAVDVSDPQNPVELGSAPVNQLGNVFAVGTTVYGMSLTEGLKIFDFSDPANPRELGGYPTYGSDILWVEGQYAYVGDTAGILVIDVSNPENPTKVYQFKDDDLYTHPDDIWVADGYLYTVNDYAESFRVYDLSDPARPAPLGALAFTEGRTSPVAVFAE